MTEPKDDKIRHIRSPLKKIINKTSTFGFFHIDKVQSSNYLSDTFYDVWFLTTRPEYVDKLATLSGNKGISKCCMFYDNIELSKSIYGFARMI